jgi:hypothetical protein
VPCLYMVFDDLHFSERNVRSGIGAQTWESAETD